MAQITVSLTEASHDLFMEYAEDAGNWGGNPWVSEGNVECGRQRRGNLADLVKKGLIEIAEYEPPDCYVIFTKLGAKYAERNGVPPVYLGYDDTNL